MGSGSLRTLILSRLLPLLLGAGIGLIVGWRGAEAGRGFGLVWIAMAIGLGTCAGAVFSFGYGRWRELPERAKRPVFLLVPLGVALVVTGVAGVFTMVAPAGWRGTLLILTTALGGVPPVAVMLAVREMARHVRSREGAGNQVADLLDLRRLAGRLLPPLGALVALATLALGAAIKQQERFEAGEALPVEGVVVFGAAGTALVAAFYLPAVGMIRREAALLCQELFDIRTADAPASLLAGLEERHRMEEIMGLTRDTFAELQAGFIVVGPLIAGIAAVFLPGGPG